MKSNWTLISIIWVLGGCASGVVFVDTLPPAGEIYLKANATEEYELVGKAPYKISTSEFKEKFKVEGPFGLEARSVGYSSQSVLVTEMPHNSDINVFINLKAENAQAAETDAERSGKLNQTLDQIFESQRLVKVGRYEDALAQLSLLQEKNPNLSAIFEMQGGVFYIQKDYPKALDSYEKAARLNPGNLEVLSMKRYLEKFVSRGTEK